MTSMMCSTMMSVMPRAWIRRTRSIAVRISAGVRPAMASSSSSTLGSQARARAISRRLRPGVPKLAAGASAKAPRPTKSMISRALARATAVFGRRRNAPIVTLSRTDIDTKVSGTWKVRAIPMRARASGASAVTSRPWKCTLPLVGARSPVRQLKNVDFPAPFGPISPSTSPGLTATEASSTALKAPNALVILRASSSMRLLGRGGFGFWRRPRRHEHRQNAARQEARNHDDDGAVNDEGEAGALAAEQAVGNLLQRHQDHGADQRSKQQPAATKGGHDQHFYRDQNAEPRIRIDESEHQRIEGSGNGRDASTQHIGIKLIAACRHPQ